MSTFEYQSEWKQKQEMIIDDFNRANPPVFSQPEAGLIDGSKNEFWAVAKPALKTEDLFGIIELLKLLILSKGSRSRVGEEIQNSVERVFGSISASSLDYLFNNLNEYEFKNIKEKNSVKKMLERLILKKKFREKTSKIDNDEEGSWENISIDPGKLEDFNKIKPWPKDSSDKIPWMKDDFYFKYNQTVSKTNPDFESLTFGASTGKTE